MPELPEVETIRRDIKTLIAGQSFVEVIVRDARVIRQPVRDFVRALRERRIKGIRRRGKALILELGPDKSYLVVQVMMTGQLVYSLRDDLDRHRRVSFMLSNGGYLHYNDQRLFGRLQVVRDLAEISYLRALGPEPLGAEFSAARLSERLAGRNVAIKTILMNHAFVAGIGNIYASEILFQSRIHPLRPARSLNEKEVKKLCAATVKVLEEAVRFRGTSMRNYRDGRGQRGGFSGRIRVYGRENKKCPRCARPLRKTVLSGRSTFFCGHCQK